MDEKPGRPLNASNRKWWNSTILAIGLASLFSDWSHEVATAVLPAFLLSIGGTAATLGLIEGIADGISSIAKLGGGWLTDRLERKKPLAVSGYVVTALATASFGFCTRVSHAFFARTVAWFGRGIRSPAKKTLLAASTDPRNYGKAFGLERAMDTTGAILGPATALWLLSIHSHHYPPIFFWTLLPGIAAAAAIGIFVKEKPAPVTKKLNFGTSLKQLPPEFKKFMIAVGVFGLGDFTHTLLILYAAQTLAKIFPADEAAQYAVGLYIFHNVVYAVFSYVAGHFADRYDKRILLASGYFLAAATALLLIVSPANFVLTAVILGLAGLYVAVEEALEDSFAAELLPAEIRGTGFGTLAFVNAIGDFGSSIAIGFLWAAYGSVAFAYSVALFVLGGALVLFTRPAR